MNPDPLAPPSSQKPKTRVIDSWWTFVVATLVLGPLALPLLWRNPRVSRRWKVIGSIVVIVFTLLLIQVAAKTIEPLLREYETILNQP